jgi:putative nucleotidyltransferase with HDIG domain
MLKRLLKTTGDATIHAVLGPRVRLWAFVLAVTAGGTFALARAWVGLLSVHLDGWLIVLAFLTVACGRFPIKVPGRPATVSVSEVFIFASILLFGPAPATLTVALDGLWASFSQKDRRIYRTLFNVAEPAFSTWVAGSVFFAAAGLAPLIQPHQLATIGLVLPSAAMTLAYFLSNSLLQATAVALENETSVLTVWGEHALYLSINYYAASSLATLGVENAKGPNLEVVGLVAPLLVLSYVAYESAASRMDDVHKHINEVEHLYQATVETLAVAVDAKDQVTHGHIRRVQRHTIALAKALGVTDENELKALEAASLLHDVGKLAVPDYVLNKPGALSRSEFDRIKLHASTGATILKSVEFPYPVVPIVRHHHEQWNGKGYPDGLAGEGIPLGARILTVVDCFDAITSDRPYRRAMTDQQAIAVLLERRGSMYDPRVVDAFIGLIPMLRREDGIVEARSAGSDDVHEAAAQASRQNVASAGSLARAFTLLHPVGTMLEEALASSMPDAEGCLFAAVAEHDALVAVRTTAALADVATALELHVGEGLAGWVAANRYTIVNSNPDLDLGDVAEQLNLRSCTATPVFALGDLVGVLAVYKSQKQAFNQDDVRFVGRLAQEIGVTIARAQESAAAQAGSRPKRAAQANLRTFGAA